MTKEVGFGLKKPCPRCPFRMDVPGYLRRARAQEIAESIADGSIFHCHQTTVDGIEIEDDGMEFETLVAGPDSQFCAGALIVLERCESPNQAMRMAENLGYYDPTMLDMEAPVARTMIDFVNHHDPEFDEENEPECCHIANGGCEAPAGMMMGGIVLAVEATGDLHDCPTCGEPVCESCSDSSGVCAYCSDDEEEGEDDGE